MYLSTQPVANQEFTIFVTGTKTFSFSQWSDDVTTCGGYTYWLKKSDDTDPPSWISLNSNTRTFTITGATAADKGTHTFKLYGRSTTYTTAETKSVTFTVTMKCIVTSFTTSNMADSKYYLTHAAATFSL